MNDINFPQPVAIGGVGGSGTRLVAEIVKQLDYFIGDDLNEANDNLLFTLLFKDISLWNAAQEDLDERWGVLENVVAKGIKPTDKQVILLKECINTREQHTENWLSERVDTALKNNRNNTYEQWGWKEPNTHIFLPALIKRYPKVKYIHVMRNGLDMAYSKNQNQLKLWGEKLLGYKPAITPEESLKYWIEVHKRIVDLQQIQPENIIIINYDELSSGSQSEMNKIIQFTDVDVKPERLNLLQKLCIPQDSVARYKDFNNDFVTQEQYHFLEKLGFKI